MSPFLPIKPKLAMLRLSLKLPCFFNFEKVRRSVFRDVKARKMQEQLKFFRNRYLYCVTSRIFQKSSNENFQEVFEQSIYLKITDLFHCDLNL